LLTSTVVINLGWLEVPVAKAGLQNDSARLFSFSNTSDSYSSQPIESIVSAPLFSASVTYAYIGRINSSGPQTYCEGLPMYPSTLYRSVVYFNFTKVAISETDACDAKIEVYHVQISSDTGTTEDYALFVGTNFNASFSNSTLLANATSSQIPNLFDLTSTGIWGLFAFNWTTGNSKVDVKVGNIGSYTSKPSGLGLWSNGKPNTITVTVHRIGWITLTGNSVATFKNVNDKVNIQQVQLGAFGSGFVYNKIVPDDELSQIDLLHPLDAAK
jgi:hypothetical protein